MIKFKATCIILTILFSTACILSCCKKNTYKLIEGSSKDYRVYASNDSIKIVLTSDEAVQYFKNDVKMLSLDVDLKQESFGDEDLKLVYVMQKTINPSLLTSNTNL